MSVLVRIKDKILNELPDQSGDESRIEVTYEDQTYIFNGNETKSFEENVALAITTADSRLEIVPDYYS